MVSHEGWLKPQDGWFLFQQCALLMTSFICQSNLNWTGCLDATGMAPFFGKRLGEGVDLETCEWQWCLPTRGTEGTKTDTLSKASRSTKSSQTSQGAVTQPYEVSSSVTHSALYLSRVFDCAFFNVETGKWEVWICRGCVGADGRHHA